MQDFAFSIMGGDDMEKLPRNTSGQFIVLVLLAIVITVSAALSQHRTMQPNCDALREQKQP
jgi:hypothetical protein